MARGFSGGLRPRFPKGDYLPFLDRRCSVASCSLRRFDAFPEVLAV